MEKFNSRKINRLFAFGCSFTMYGWTTWPMIVAVELGVPYRNYANPGAGNQYIFNTIIQADAYYKFNQNDLIMICWTNVCREDRFVGNKWIIPGNIYTQQVYSDEWVEKFVDPAGMALRDYATISATDALLKSKGCEYHFLSMIDITKVFDQYNYGLIDSFLKKDSKKMINELITLFDEPLSKIKPNFYDVLWDGKIRNKMDNIWKQFKSKFSDAHPSPIEHYKYLQTVLEYDFKETTVAKVQEAQDTWETILYEWCNKPQHDSNEIYPHELLYAKTNIAYDYERVADGWHSNIDP
jgi:hypothetical protein